jgi:hypothetical protein
LFLIDKYIDGTTSPDSYRGFFVFIR